MSNIHEQPNSDNSRLEHSRSISDSSYVLVSSRPSPFIGAEKVKRDFSARLDGLLTELEIELSIALNVDPLSQPTAYELGEIAGYLSRVGRVLRRHEQAAIDRAAKADAEHVRKQCS
jgi:hypothetical protein